MIKGYLYTYAAIAIFSSLEVLSKLATLNVPPLVLWLFRMLLGSLALLPFVKFEKLRCLTLKEWLKIGVLGSVTVGWGVSLFHIGLYHLSASEVAIIFSSNPLFVLLFSRIFKKEKISLRVYSGMFLGFGGVLVVSYRPGHLFSTFYSLYILISAVLFSLYTVFGRDISRKTSSATLNFFAFIFGSLAVFPLVFLSGERIALPHEDIFYVLYLGLVVTGIAYMLFFEGVKTVGANLSSMAFFVKPWLASFLAFLILNEEFTVREMAGGALMAISLIIAYWPSKTSE